MDQKEKIFVFAMVKIIVIIIYFVICNLENALLNVQQISRVNVLVEIINNTVKYPSNVKDIIQQMDHVFHLATEFRIIVYVVRITLAIAVVMNFVKMIFAN